MKGECNFFTEWKESWRDEYLKWICGFANAEGGVLVIGRNDKRGVAVGAPDVKHLLEVLPNKIRDVLGISGSRSDWCMKPARNSWRSASTLIPTRSATRASTTFAAAAPSRNSKERAADKFLLRKARTHLGWCAGP